MLPSNISAAMLGIRAYLDRQRGLGDQIAGVRADDGAAENAVGRLVVVAIGERLIEIKDGGCRGRGYSLALDDIDNSEGRIRLYMAHPEERPADARDVDGLSPESFEQVHKFVSLSARARIGCGSKPSS